MKLDHSIVDINKANAFYESLWKQANRIPGYITKNEGRFLFLLTLKYSEIGDIVEIGPFYGRSSVILGKGIKQTENTSRKLICIDNFAKQTSNLYPNTKNPKENLLRNVKKFELDDIFKLYEDDGAKALCSFQSKNKGLIFIDSEHTKKQISKEFPAALRAINTKGIILIHDYTNPRVDSDYSDWIKKHIVLKFNTIFIKDQTPKYSGNGLLLVTFN